RAAAPTAAAALPAALAAGTATTVSVTPAGTGPFRYAWSVVGCSVATPGSRTTAVTCPASSAGSTVTARVTVTQADGQAVQVGADLPVGDPASGATAGPVGQPVVGPGAALPLSWSVPRSQDGIVSAVLRRGQVPAPDTAVLVEHRPRGSAVWSVLDRVRTDAAGRAALGATTARAGWFRFAVVDSGQSVRSASVYLRVPTRLTASAAARGRVVATLRTTAGARLPGVTLVLQRRAAGTARWVGVTRARTDARGTVAGRVTASRTTYVRWLFAGGDAHLAASSGMLRLG
ncbi:MAG: hypothetical protein WB441_16460, partial [Nocardioidaceae bacterium]